MKHIVCFSGGHDSSICAIELVRRFGKEVVTLLNHNIHPKYEHPAIKEYKRAIANYLCIPITYANIDGITDENSLPSQFEVCIKAGALTDSAGHALCTNRLKTEPFRNWLKVNGNRSKSLFENEVVCTIYYGFSAKEEDRMIRRTGVMGSMGYKTDYVLATWKDRTIFSTSEIGIDPPMTYQIYKHANCTGCLKASLLHWYVVYVHDLEIFNEGVKMEEELDYTIHTVIRNKIKRTISLQELAPIFQKMMCDKVPATEHQSMIKFANLLRKYQIEEIDGKKPCECLA